MDYKKIGKNWKKYYRPSHEIVKLSNLVNLAQVRSVQVKFLELEILALKEYDFQWIILELLLMKNSNNFATTC